MMIKTPFFARLLSCIVMCVAITVVRGDEPAGTKPIDIGSRRELFVDQYLIDTLQGGARLVLHRPTPREISLTHDEPWEGNVSGIATIFRDGNIYRMYYCAGNSHPKTRLYSNEEVICYAESQDGILWTKPQMGIVEFDGSKKNNIILVGCNPHGSEYGEGLLPDYKARALPNLPVKALRVACNFTPFKDPNPECQPAARYKAIGGFAPPYPVGTGGLWTFQSADGIRWEPMRDGPVNIKGVFDSQNVAFWDATRKEYLAYFRLAHSGVRAIATCTSRDFLQWTETVHLEYDVDTPNEQLYTNAVLPYHRAPHLYLGFPTRFSEGRGSIQGLTEGLFMSSRDGVHFHRWAEAFIPPGQNKDKWGNRSNYIWWGLVETKSDLPGASPELSLYTNEHYYTDGGPRTRRYTLRQDGFVSVNAPFAGGEFTTKPFSFTGQALEINYATSAAGGLRVEVQNTDGKAVSGFALDDCPEMFGDEIEGVVLWKDGSDVSALAGKPVRLRFVMKDADLYAIRFRQ